MKSAAGNEVASSKAPAHAGRRPASEPSVQPANPSWQLLAPGAQAKLAVSTPDDPAEHEADRVADRVMRTPRPTVQRKCAACASGGAPCPKCEAEQRVQRKAAAASPAPSTSLALAPQLGRGAPLDHGARSFFEPRFGQDFGGVRVHTDDVAAQTAASFGARAFTLGGDIAFARGEYQPSTAAGQLLLAHELTHVLQQTGGRSGSGDGADGLSVRSRGIAPMIQRACVAGLIPQLACCDPAEPFPGRVGTRAHRQLQIASAIISPGTLGEVAIPPTTYLSTPPPRGWRFPDLYRSTPPLRAPSRAGIDPVISGWHPEVNLGLPVARVPPYAPSSGAGVGEIKPLSPYGLRTGPADLVRNIARYDYWSLSLGGSPIVVSPLIPGGPSSIRPNGCSRSKCCRGSTPIAASTGAAWRVPSSGRCAAFGKRSKRRGGGSWSSSRSTGKSS
ncbi:MAG TPA: DUF4157 domain-containing protein [Gammaproteobacteria bacterium]|nr:DUF4157 domain-containing protein [Gammaproteobacteria bacterium]